MPISLHACEIYVHFCAIFRLSLNHLWHSHFTVFLKSVHHQTIAANVVDALKGKQTDRGIIIQHEGSNKPVDKTCCCVLIFAMPRSVPKLRLQPTIECCQLTM